MSVSLLNGSSLELSTTERISVPTRIRRPAAMVVGREKVRVRIVTFARSRLEICRAHVKHDWLLFVSVLVTVVVLGNRYAAGLAVADFSVPHAQIHAADILLDRNRNRLRYLYRHTVPNNVHPQAVRYHALLQGVSTQSFRKRQLVSLVPRGYLPRLIYFARDHLFRAGGPPSDRTRDLSVLFVANFDFPHRHGDRRIPRSRYPLSLCDQVQRRRRSLRADLHEGVQQIRVLRDRTGPRIHIAQDSDHGHQDTPGKRRTSRRAIGAFANPPSSLLVHFNAPLRGSSLAKIRRR